MKCGEGENSGLWMTMAFYSLNERLKFMSFHGDSYFNPANHLNPFLFFDIIYLYIV
ncbi:unnamed protein product [Brugia timori]|uniref:Uncharacterized protein n=1 Tax=Brugia timori TaxID=42155 RepID=A0A0R3QDG1_9BILA|nr:unnamed protein product [Brugia timori]